MNGKVGLVGEAGARVNLQLGAIAADKKGTLRSAVLSEQSALLATYKSKRKMM